MTDTFNRLDVRKEDHSTFGGIIYPSDFDTNYSSGTIAQRIVSDKNFDEQCRRNIISRNKYMEELKNEESN